MKRLTNIHLFSLILLSGCSGSNTPSAPAPTVATISQALTTLQTQGKLPTLDVSSSVAGTDSDMNGVRDDIDKFIAGLPDTAAEKKALSQFAMAEQATMTVDLTNAAAVASTSLALHRGVACVWSTYPSGQHAKVMLIEELSANTIIRLTAYEKYNASRNGSVSQQLSGPTCN